LEKANEVWERATKLLGVIATMDEGFIKRVGRWKVNPGLGLGDSFVAGCAEEHAAILVTTDPHFLPVQQGGLIRVEFIR
jgi:predicted nucleic acid-binding protein